MLKIIVLFLVGISLSYSSFGQADSVAIRLQQVKKSQDDSSRISYADEIPTYLAKIAFEEYPDLPKVQYLGYKKCVNEDVELFSWAIPLHNGQMFYNWFRFKDNDKVYFLKSFSKDGGEESAWLYYDLIGFKKKGELCFVLLGWSKTPVTNQKIVHICQFKEDGSIDFDNRMLRRGNSKSSSLGFEYALDGSMMLKQDKRGKRIIFDHLAPFNKEQEGNFMFYGADASYDALVLKGGEWWYKENVKQ